MYLAAVQTHINANHGGTFRVEEDGSFSLPGHTDGYYVSRKGAESQVYEADLSYQELQRYVDIHSTVLAAPDNYFGVWIEDGTAWLDVSTWVQNYHVAEALARKNEQLAFWDIAEGRAYTV